MSNTSRTLLTIQFLLCLMSIRMYSLVGPALCRPCVSAARRLSSRIRMPKSVNSAPSISVRTAGGRPGSSQWVPMNPQVKSAKFVSANSFSRTCWRIRCSRLRHRRCSYWDQVASTSSLRDKGKTSRKSKPRESSSAKSLLLTTKSSRSFWRKSRKISTKNRSKMSNCRPQMIRQFRSRKKSKPPKMKSRVK